MDDTKIARIGERVGKLDLADHILSWDKKQAREIVETTVGVPSLVGDTNQYRTLPNPDARRCQLDPDHGILQMHASGSQLICCVTRPAPCTYAEPVSR
jgi:hypothetical protein